MSEFIIVTDSCADLPAALVEQLDIRVLPLMFNIDGKEYRNLPDNREMAPEQFFDLLRHGKTATTSAVNVGMFTEVLEPLLEEGRDVLVLSFSSGLSTTYNSGVIAAEELREKYPQRKLYVVDSLCASLGQGLFVWLAAQKRSQGQDIDQVYRWAEDSKLSICHQFTVNDLFHLKRGGRVSAATAVVGTMLSIKPVLHVDNEGHLVNIAKARGRGAAIKALMDKMEQTVVEPDGQTVFISHGDCPEDARKLADMIRARWAVADVIINPIGPVIGAHAGPGTLALFYVGSQR